MAIDYKMALGKLVLKNYSVSSRHNNPIGLLSMCQ